MVIFLECQLCPLPLFMPVMPQNGFPALLRKGFAGFKKYSEFDLGKLSDVNFYNGPLFPLTAFCSGGMTVICPSGGSHVAFANSNICAARTNFS